MVEELCVNSFDNLYAGVFHQFTVVWMGGLGLWIFMIPCMRGLGLSMSIWNLEG
jgi:hypothetical protein